MAVDRKRLFLSFGQLSAAWLLNGADVGSAVHLPKAHKGKRLSPAEPSPLSSIESGDATRERDCTHEP